MGYYRPMQHKTTGQQNQVDNPELLALCVFRGGLAEWPNATGLTPGRWCAHTIQGFESLTRRQIVAPLMKAGTSTRGMNRTAEAARVANSSIRQTAVELNRRFHSDVSRLPLGDGQGGLLRKE